MKNLKPIGAIGTRQNGLRPETDEIVSEFLSESREYLDQIERELCELGGGVPGNELLSSIYRSLHSIKGASGFLGFATIEMVTHAGESILSRIRERTLALGPEAIAMLHKTVDSLRAILDSIETTGREGNGDEVELSNRLPRQRAPDVTRPAQSAVSYEDVLAKSTVVQAAADEDCAKPIGQLLIERAGVPPAAVQAARDLQRLGDLRTMGEILVSQGMVTSVAAREIVEFQEEARAAKLGSTSVRVEVKLLDKIVKLAEDVVRSAGRLAHMPARSDPAASRANQRLVQVATRLHREAVNTRVQPLVAIEAPLGRLVKDLSNLSGKLVRLESSGTDIRVDRVVLAAIKDPLQHLVRNAIDHGIEPPQARALAGKPAEGRITISATRADRQVVIEVSDDGAGIDLERVRQTAVERGIVPSDRIAATSDAEIAALVFLPGFTTARTVSHISGRGVGMDIVKAKVEKIGGSVTLLTQKGFGTIVRLAFPLAQQRLLR
jgi:two-component system, chemotaxis family, sensor kinase CheA